MNETKPAPSKRRKLIIPFVSAAAAMLFGISIFILPPPLSNQLHTTATGQYEQVFIGPTIRIDMNANSSMTVSNAQPPEIELLQGSVYFDIEHSDAATSKLIAIVDNVRIHNIGTRFSLERQNNGGKVAVVDGQVKIQIGSQSHLINAGQQVAFDSSRIIEQTSIVNADVAPWRQNK